MTSIFNYEYVCNDDKEYKLTKINEINEPVIYESKGDLLYILRELIKSNNNGRVDATKFCNMLVLYVYNKHHFCENDINKIFVKTNNLLTDIFLVDKDYVYQLQYYLRFKIYRRLLQPNLYCSYEEDKKICCNERYRGKVLCKYHNMLYRDILRDYIDDEVINIITSYV